MLPVSATVKILIAHQYQCINFSSKNENFGLIYCDYYGAGFPVHRPAFAPGAIRYKRIPFRYLGINHVNRYGFHGGSGGGGGGGGGEEDVNGHDDSDGHDGEDMNGGGLGLVRRYLGVLAPSNGGFFPSLFSHHNSQESGNGGRYGDRHGSDHGGGHGSGFKDRHGYGGSHGGDSEHGNDRDLSFSHRDEHHSYSDRSPGLLGIRVNGLSWLRRPFGKGLFGILG
uniref:Uncharacterized protein n=1 Tax=Tetranychus urticae TaxID=32264 RepID=T1KZW8_TETUR